MSSQTRPPATTKNRHPVPDRELILDLQKKLKNTVAPLLEGYEKVALVDFPHHPNVGDSAIWLGEIELLSQLGIEPCYTCDIHTYHPNTLRRAIGPDGLILIHGGGNFGDIWPYHQRLREQVVQDFPDHPIVQLPQSIQFNESSALERARRIFDAHPRFTLVCRDQHSHRFSQEHFQCRTLLAPDAAFFLDLAALRASPDHDVMYLARSDVERPATPLLDGKHTDLRILRSDWLQETPTWIDRLAATLTRQLNLRPRLNPILRKPTSATYTPVAWNNVRRGCRLLSRGRVVVSDRLHAHILCILMGIPHCFLDNNYGKNRRFWTSWTKDSKTAHWCETQESVETTVRELLAHAEH